MKIEKPRKIEKYSIESSEASLKTLMKEIEI